MDWTLRLGSICIHPSCKILANKIIEIAILDTLFVFKHITVEYSELCSVPLYTFS